MGNTKSPILSIAHDIQVILLYKMNGIQVIYYINNILKRPPNFLKCSPQDIQNTVKSVQSGTKSPILSMVHEQLNNYVIKCGQMTEIYALIH